MAQATPYWLIRQKALERKIDRGQGIPRASRDGCPHCRNEIRSGEARQYGQAGAYHLRCWNTLKRLLGGDMRMA